MVLTSAQISQMNGAFQGSAMNQMAYSGMIGQYSGERMAGSAMNMAGSVASPMLAGGLALAGLDPFSMAIKGGMAGFGVAGMGGAAAGALGGAALVGAPLMAAGYVGGQFMQGAQQHQQLGAQLRSGFGFRNQFGGTGFAGHEVGMIGSSMRDMAGQMGPGGEQVGFEELGRLAANMGRMGMAQGVRNAKDFTDKFRQMVGALKEIATEMGTSLEEAQKMMAGMKQSGVFNMNQQVKFAKMVRQGAQAGGMATSEVTGMMSVGSQISRMIGGRGVAGARAGIETITNIGVAQQMGILSEEDIYNATGETGAMGRRALATQELQGAAQFLKSGLGRRMVAAMAGKNGQLDEGNAAEFATGGVGIERTREMWQKGLKNVGRANFLRNEGRLRGEVLAKYGGLAPAMAMSGWLESKGIDLNVDNDRAMLFLQRNQGMGRDEADDMMKQMRALPQILKERGIAEREENIAQRFRQRQQTVGLEGVKRKLDHAVASVRGEIQQAGSGFMESLENEFEGVVNYLTNTRVKEFRRDVGRAFETGRMGGATGRAAISQTFGIGGGIATNMRGLQAPARGMSGLEAVGGGIEKALGLDTGFMREFNRADRGRLAKLGFDFGGLDQAGIAKKLQGIQGFAEAAAGAGVTLDIGGSKGRLRDMYSQVKGLGEERAKSVQAMLLGSDMPEAKAIGERLARASTPAEKGRIIAGLNRALGRPDEGKLYATGDMMGVYNTSGHLTFKDEASAIGEGLLGTSGHGGKQANAVADWIAKSDSFFMKNTVGTALKLGVMGLTKAGLLGGVTTDEVLATGAFAKTEEGRSIAAKSIDADARTRREAADTVQTDIARLQIKQSQGTISDPEKGQLQFLNSVRAAQRLQAIGGANAKPGDVAKAAHDLGMTPEELMKRAAGVVGLVHSAQHDAIMQTEGKLSAERIASMKAGGLITTGPAGEAVLSAAMARKFHGKPAGKFLEAMIQEESQMASINDATSFEQRSKILNNVLAGKTSKDQEDALHGMSVKELRELASGMKGMGATDRQELISSMATTRERLARGGKGQGMRNLAGMLGSSMSAKDINRILKEKGAEGLAGTLAEDLGLGAASKGREDIMASITALKTGDIATAGDRVGAILGGPEMAEARKKKSLAAAEQSDPLQAKANDLLKGIGDKLDTQNKTLGDIATNTSKTPKDAEEKTS